LCFILNHPGARLDFFTSSSRYKKYKKHEKQPRSTFASIWTAQENCGGEEAFILRVQEHKRLYLATVFKNRGFFFDISGDQI